MQTALPNVKIALLQRFQVHLAVHSASHAFMVHLQAWLEANTAVV
jgi:hypothetical protein